MSKVQELRCTVKTRNRIPAKNISLEINLPEAFKLVSGDLAWTGDVPVNSDVTVIQATVKSIKTGNWTIDIRTKIDPKENSGFGRNGGFSIYVSISENSAQWGKYPPWKTSTPGAPAPVTPAGGNTVNPGLSSQFENNNPEFLPPPPATVTATSIPSTTFKNDLPSSPIKIDMAISDMPTLNVPVDLNLTITSRRDAPKSMSAIKLPKGVDLVDGTLEWQGDLKANTPVSYTAKVIFKEIGKWTLEGIVKHKVDRKNSWGDSKTIYLNIGNDQSTIGWPAIQAKVKQTRSGDGKLIKSKDNSKDEPILEDLRDLPEPPAITLDGIVQDRAELRWTPLFGQESLQVKV